MTRKIALAASVLAAITSWSAVADPSDDESRIQIGFAIAPVPLNLHGRNLAQVGLGSYFVNSGGCNGCHTYPPFTAGHNPFLGQPEEINAARYLGGGRPFGTIITPNLTPDDSGLPVGLTLNQFITFMRTGRDPDGSGRIEQVMPWPEIGKMSDHDLTAIYEYLTAIPSLPGNR
jgi:hypothetical protein